MSRFAQIIHTQESLEEQEMLATAQDDVGAAETATEVAEVSNEVGQDVAEIEAVDTGISDAEGAQDTIAELTGVAEASLAADGEQVPEGEVGQDGDGLSETEAAVVEITHESIMRSLGFQVERKTYTPESFNDKKSSRQVTMEALEGLKDSAKKVGEGIMKALRAAFDMVVGFIAKLINNRALMEKHLVNLTKRVTEAKEGPKKEAKLKAGATILSLNGASDATTAVRVLEGLDHCLGIAEKAADVMYRNKSLEDATRIGMEVQEALAALPANGKGKGILGGGKAFETNMSAASTTDDAGKVSMAVIEVGGTKEEIDAPSKSEMNNVLNAAKKVLGHLRAAEKIRSRLKDFVMAVQNASVKAVNMVKTRVGSDESKARATGMDAFRVAVMTARTIMTKFMTATFSHSFKAVKAAADYVSAGLRNMGDNGDESKAPAAAGDAPRLAN
jgi:hypothetical protein